ncbi:DUF2795 domain-containing protein [Streptomyces sp. NPDC021096]|uniref:DUF2795 domain-containing protein n=1 Tax=Streptomyces sp. NPDC021096 TaxID=3154792 RepID=UPI0033D583F7
MAANEDDEFEKISDETETETETDDLLNASSAEDSPHLLPGMKSAMGIQGYTVKKWPATKAEIIAAAKADGADKDRLDLLSQLPSASYKDIQALKRDWDRIIQG